MLNYDYIGQDYLRDLEYGKGPENIWWDFIYLDFLFYLNRNKALYTLLTPIGYKIRIACLELTCLPKKCQNKLKKQIQQPHEF